MTIMFFTLINKIFNGYEDIFLEENRVWESEEKLCLVSVVSTFSEPKQNAFFCLFFKTF